RAERSTVSDAGSLAEPPAADPAAPLAAAQAPSSSATDPRTAAPPTATEDLSYFNRLERSNQPAEELKPAPKPPAADPKSGTDKPAAEHGKVATAGSAKESAKEKDAPAAAAAPSPGSGYAVQVAALN